jgi:hypothetical protein
MIWPFRQKQPNCIPDALQRALAHADFARCQLAAVDEDRHRQPSEDDFAALKEIHDIMWSGSNMAQRIERDLRARKNGEPEGLQTMKWPDYR